MRLILLLLSFSFFSCHDTLTTIKGCCADNPQSAVFGTAWIIVPNIFSPNGDGIFDTLTIHGDSAIIREIRIWNEDNILVYHHMDIPNINNTIKAWDGKFLGVATPGVYDYEITFESFDQIKHTIRGSVCNFNCDADVSYTFPRYNCFFDIHRDEFPPTEPCSN